MSEIIFAKTRYSYDSYTDFRKLVDLSGFAQCFVDEIDIHSDNIYIVSPINGEMHEFTANVCKGGNMTDNATAKVLMWNLERPGDGTVESFAADNHNMLGKYFHNILVSDKILAEKCGLNYITMGGHEGLGQPGLFEHKKYDLIHLSCYSNHRGPLFHAPDKPRNVFLGYSVAGNCWGQQRHEKLQATKFMLNIHQDNHPFLEPLRFTLAVMYGLPIITEKCDNYYPYHLNFDVMTNIFPLDKITGAMLAYSRDMYSFQLGFRDMFLKTYPFRLCVEKAVAEL